MFTQPPQEAEHSARPRSIATLDGIVEATRALLAERSYTGLSMRAVAARAGVSAAAIYKHFRNKRALVDHVVNTTLQDFHVELLRVASRHPPGSFDRVVALGEAYIRLALDKPEHFKVLFTPLKPRPTKLSDLPGEGGFRLLRQSMAEAMDAGRIRRGDPDLATFFLWSRVHGIVMLLMACDFGECLPLDRAEITPLKLFELSRVFLWEGFRPPAAGDAPDPGENP